MPNFHFQALNSAGQAIAGELQAENVQQAVAELEAAGLIVQSIGHASPESKSATGETPAAEGATGGTERRVERPEGDFEQAILKSHMTDVLEQGRAIAPALRAYADEMPPGRRRRQLLTVIRVLESGDVAAATVAQRRLPEYWIPLLSAATSSRDPGRVLREFLEESQRAEELRRQWWLTLAYPVIVAGIAFAVLTALSVLVIPSFREIFREFDLNLPPFTLLILGVSQWISSGWFFLVAAVVILLVALLASARQLLPESIRSFFGEHIGVPWGRTTAVARLARFTADLLEAGLATPDALRIAGFATRRARLRRAAWRLARELDAGSAVGTSTPPSELTATVHHALRAPMPAAARVHLLKEVAHCYADRSRTRLSWTRGVVEPMTIFAVGFVVAAVVLALFLPLVMLINGLTG